MRILIRDGQLIDGTGTPPLPADVMVENGQISAIAPDLPKSADKIIEARGLVVAPGFIDIHTHWDFVRATYPDAPSLLHQGITSVVTGNCGSSLAPISDHHRQALHSSMQGILAGDHELGSWKTFEEYLASVKSQPMGLNMVPLVGHCTIRTAAMGTQNRGPTADELLLMKRMLLEALDSGAFGLSFGLVYLPGLFAKTEELISLARTASSRGRIITAHMRNEGDRLLDAVDEVLGVAESSLAPVQVSHLKAMGKSNWGRVDAALSRLEAAQRRNVSVACDVYPYTATSTTILSLIPEKFLTQGAGFFVQALDSDGYRNEVATAMDSLDDQGRRPRSQVLGYENIVVVSLKHRPEAAGRSLASLAEEDGLTPARAAVCLTQAEGGPFRIVNHAMSEQDVVTILKHDLSTIGSDATGLAAHSPGRPHPRNYGTFPRILGRYVREKKTLTLEEAISKMTARSAARLGIRKRGTLAVGNAADIVIFDANTVQDKATFEDPHQLPTGIVHVIVNGQLAVTSEKRTGVFAGQVMRAS